MLRNYFLQFFLHCPLCVQSLQPVLLQVALHSVHFSQLLLQVALAKNDLSDAQRISMQTGGVIGEVAEEGIRILEEQNGENDFASSFDISASLAVRKLEQYLSVLGTIGGVAPFLGLFGTVVRILYTFQDLW